MALMLHCDFNQIDWVGYQKSTDAANLFDALGVSISALRRQAHNGAGTSVSAGTAFARYGSDRAKYGKDRLSWVTGTGANPVLDIGYNGTNHDIGSFAATFTAVLWVKGQAGLPADTFKLRLMKGAGTLVAESAASAMNGNWIKFTVTGTISPSDNPFIRLYRFSGTDAMTIEVTGAMIVSGSTAPTWFNAGSVSVLGDLTPYWMDGRWGLGWVRAHQHVAPLGKADLTLNNDDKRFSPEYASGPLFGDLLPNLLVQIGDPDFGIWWTGWVDEWSPEPGLTRRRRSILKATDARRFIDKPLAYLPLQESTAANTLVSTMLLPTIVTVPNSTLGVPASSGVATAWDAAPTETVPYYGDGNEETDPAHKIIADVVGGVQGKFWFNRHGQYQFTAGQGDDTPASYTTISDSIWMDADYVSDMIVNSSNAKVYIRKATPGATLWELDVPYDLEVGEAEIERVFYRDSVDGKTITGAVSSTVNVSGSSTGGSIAIFASKAPSAQSVEITAENFAGGTGTVDTITVTGTAVVAKKTVEKSYEDATSLAANGLHTETLNFNWVQSRAWANKLVHYRVNRFKDPQRFIPWLTLQANKKPAEAFACHVGAPLLVTDTQTSHSDFYACIGEQHTVKQGTKEHVVKIFLELLYPTTVANTTI